MQRDRVLRNAGARDAMVAIATGDEIAVHVDALTALGVAYACRAAGEIIDRDVLRFPDDAAAGTGTRIRQVFLQLGLSIDHDALSSERLQIDAMRAAVERKLDAVVRQTLAHHARSHTGLVQQIDRSPLEQSGADARFDVFARVSLQHDRLDAARVQQL